MSTITLTPRLHRITLGHGQVYLWRDPDSLTLIDTGTAGSGEAIARALGELGMIPEDLDRAVLTHAHEDHAGGAAEIETRHGVTVIAHRLDVPVVRGQSPAAEPVFDGAPAWERELYVNKPALPPAPPARVDRELEGDDVLDFGGGAQVISVPGHTDGSIALYLPDSGVLFTGDAVANVGGRTTLGVFNTERDQAIASLRRLAELDVDTACFGHGDPLVRGASTALRETAAAL